MMILPGPSVLEHLIRDRQDRLQPSRRATRTSIRAGVRVTIGRALIAAGASLSGERVERPARRSSSPHAI